MLFLTRFRFCTKLHVNPCRWKVWPECSAPIFIEAGVWWKWMLFIWPLLYSNSPPYLEAYSLTIYVRRFPPLTRLHSVLLLFSLILNIPTVWTWFSVLLLYNPVTVTYIWFLVSEMRMMSTIRRSVNGSLKLYMIRRATNIPEALLFLFLYINLVFVIIDLLLSSRTTHVNVTRGIWDDSSFLHPFLKRREFLAPFNYSGMLPFS